MPDYYNIFCTLYPQETGITDEEYEHSYQSWLKEITKCSWSPLGIPSNPPLTNEQRYEMTKKIIHYINEHDD